MVFAGMGLVALPLDLILTFLGRPMATTPRVRAQNPAHAGWVLFMVFAGVGLVALPLDLIRSFLGRPTATIPKSEYIKRARGLGQRAIAIKARHRIVRNSVLRCKKGARLRP